MATSETLSQSLVFDIQFGAIRGDGQARRALEQMASQAFGAGTVKGIKGASSQMERDMKRIMGAAFKVGMRSEGRELYRVFQQSSKAIVKAREEVARIDQKMLRASDNASRQRLQRERNALTQRINAENRHLEGSIKELDAASQRFGDMIETASRNASRNFSQSVQKAGEGFSKIVSSGLDLRNGMPDPQQMGAQFGQAMTGTIGPALAKFGAKQAGKGGMMGALGSAAAGIGAAAAAIAGAAAAIAAIGAVIAAAYGQAKDLNKALLSGQTASDMFDTLATRGRGLGEMLSETRRAALNTAYQFRMTGEEVSTMMSEISGAGLMMRQWGDYTGEATDRMKQLSMVTRQVITMQNAFGVSASEIAGFQSTMFHEMGRGLERVNDAFTSIYAAAGKSAMSTKGFFTAIAEASSGMALYNFRVEDTVALLTDMVAVLGEDIAASQIGQKNAYKNMGMEQRIQTVMNAGGTTDNIFGADFRIQADNFISNFSEELSSSRFAGGALNALFDGTEVDMSKLGKMSEEAFGDMLYKLRDQGGIKGQAAARRLENMRGLAVGSQGGLMAQASNLGSLSQAGEWGMKLMEASTLLGKKGVSNMSGLTRQAYENITGRSGEDFDILQRMDRQYRAQYRAQGGAAELGAFEDWIVGAIGEQDAKQMTELQELAALPAMERLAREQYKETRSVVATLKNTIAGWLETIWGGVDGIMRAFSWGSANEEAWNDNVDSALAAIERQAVEMEKISEIEEGLQNKRAKTTDPNELAKIDQQLANLNLVRDVATTEMDKAREYYSELVRLGPEGSAAEMPTYVSPDYHNLTTASVDTDADFLTRLGTYSGNADGILQTLVSPIAAAVDPALPGTGLVQTGDDKQIAIAEARKIETSQERIQSIADMGLEITVWNPAGEGSWEKVKLDTADAVRKVLQEQGLNTEFDPANPSPGGHLTRFEGAYQFYDLSGYGEAGAIGEANRDKDIMEGRINPASGLYRPDYDDWAYRPYMVGELGADEFTSIVAHLASIADKTDTNLAGRDVSGYDDVTGTTVMPWWFGGEEQFTGPDQQFPGRAYTKWSDAHGKKMGLAMKMLTTPDGTSGGVVDHPLLGGTPRVPIIGDGPEADISADFLASASAWMHYSEADPLQEAEVLASTLMDEEGMFPDTALKDLEDLVTSSEDNELYSKDQLIELGKVVIGLSQIKSSLDEDPITTLSQGLGSTRYMAAHALTDRVGYDDAMRRLKSRTRSKDPLIAEAASRALSDLLQYERPQQDYIMRPGMPPVPFAANDTVIGVKGAGLRSLGGGTQVNIYGGDPNEVYRAVNRALKTSGRG